MNKLFFSIYSGLCYAVDDKFTNLLDDGQIPLSTSLLKDCKKCYNKRYSGFNTHKFVYIPCSCVLKKIDNQCIREKFNIQ